MANRKRSPIFDRLAGLETEYAIRFHPAEASSPRPSKFQLYRALIAAIRKRVPAVRARHFKEGVFVANGGAVWFETERVARDGGLIEASTPECRGPRELLIYQRAMDELVSEAAGAAPSRGQFTLVKNCRDFRDNIYGAQENYEAVMASGLSLFCWRVGLVLLSPLVALTWLSLLAMIVGLFLYLAVAGLLYLPLRSLFRQRQQLALLLFGRDLVTGEESGGALPAWLEWLMVWAARVLGAPLAVALFVLVRLTAFGQLRRKLLPFLVSRPIIAGAGHVDRAGHFHLADKSPAVNCVLGFGGYLWDQPVFNFGHFFKAASVESLFEPRNFSGLFSRRQRLQIGIGDSNMAEPAEFLRVGTTMLVLDALESGEPTDDLPRLKHPIRALRAICRDPSLQTRVRCTDGRSRTALEIQRCYLAFCQRFLSGRRDVPKEARQVLSLWGETLDALESAPESLVGSLDWVTKQFLLNEAGGSANWEQRKKIDIRYHELSDDGYFQRLRRAGVCKSIIEPLEVERAIRMAPFDTPAATRGRYIREFDDAGEVLSVNWRRVVIGRGRGAKVVHLRHYGKRRRRAGDRDSSTSNT